jgi:hypothetical protein
MNRHLYLRAYMAGIVVPSLWLLLVLTVYFIVRFVWQAPFPIERILPFPMALVPGIFGLWNMLYVRLYSHWHHPIGLHGMVLPFFLGPIGFAVATASGIASVDRGRLVFHIGEYLDVIPYWYLWIAPFVALAVYYLLWKYLVGYCNRALELPT